MPEGGMANEVMVSPAHAHLSLIVSQNTPAATI